MNTLQPFRTEFAKWHGLDTLQVKLGDKGYGATFDGHYDEDYILYLYKYVQDFLLTGQLPKWEYDQK